MRQNANRPTGVPMVPSKSARQTRSTKSQVSDPQTLVSAPESNLTPETPKQVSRNTKRSTLAHKATSKKNTMSSESGEGSSDGTEGGSDADEPPDSSDAQEDDGQPAVIAPSRDEKMKHHKTGRHYQNKQKKTSEAVEKSLKAKTKNKLLRKGATDTQSHQKLMEGLLVKSVPKLHHEKCIGDLPQATEGQNTDTDDDDDDYGAVDDISESDEGDDELEKLEEDMIIASYAGMGPEEDFPMLSSANPSHWNSFGIGDQLFLAHESFFDDLADGPIDDNDALLPSNFDSEQTETPRRVHFADEVDDTSTDTNSSDAESNQFSDTFLQQDRLAPSILNRIEQDSADECQSLSENEWDVRQEDGLLEYEHFGLDNDDDSITSEGSGYDTDEGETTDEDLPPPTTVAHPGSILREDSSDTFTSSGSRTRHRKFARRHSLNGPISPRTASRSIIRPAGPRMGVWVADPTKATAYIGPTGRLMLIQPARKSNRLMHVDSSSSSQQSLYELLNDSEHDYSNPTSPMLSSDINLMMSGLFHGALGAEYLHGGQVMGPPEAFYPFKSVNNDGRVVEDVDYDEDDDVFEDTVLDVGDFIDFGDGSSTEVDDDDDANENESDKSKALTKKSSSQPLDHLDGSNVTAFRRNTARVHAYFKLPKHREFMPFSPPGTTSAVRCGRQSELYAPIAPPRKRKRDNSNLVAEGSRGNTVQRRFINAHKRSKSSI